MRIRLPHFGRYFIIGLIVVATLGIAVAGYVAQGYQYDHLFSLYQKQNSQLRENGIEPTTPSPEKIAESGPVGATGATGATGTRGPGPTQDDVLQGIEKYCTLVICAGPPGADGQSVAGAQGLQGIQGAQGIQGVPGQDSTVPGPAGADGQPPLSWTQPGPLGITETCGRTDPFDPAQPTYTCS